MCIPVIHLHAGQTANVEKSMVKLFAPVYLVILVLRPPADLSVLQVLNVT